MDSYLCDNDCAGYEHDPKPGCLWPGETEADFGYQCCSHATKEITECKMCREIGDGFGPRHDGSPNCESGSIASGGTNAHCTCDVCF
jgi:hypothetical protein